MLLAFAAFTVLSLVTAFEVDVRVQAAALATTQAIMRAFGRIIASE